MSSLQFFLTHTKFLNVPEIIFFLRQSIIFASDCNGTELGLGKQRKRWAPAGLLDQPFNPVTLSLRQTACYRSFHYVFKQQIALQVRCTGRAEKKRSHVQRCHNLPVITTIRCTNQWGRLQSGGTSLIIGGKVQKRRDCPLVKKLWLWHRGSAAWSEVNGHVAWHREFRLPCTAMRA